MRCVISGDAEKRTLGGAAGTGGRSRGCFSAGALPDKRKESERKMRSDSVEWLRGQDLNLRPSGYEPDELPNCSTPRYTGVSFECLYRIPYGGADVNSFFQKCGRGGQTLFGAARLTAGKKGGSGRFKPWLGGRRLRSCQRGSRPSCRTGRCAPPRG